MLVIHKMRRIYAHSTDIKTFLDPEIAALFKEFSAAVVRDTASPGEIFIAAMTQGSDAVSAAARNILK